jgi:hypothetical protein
MSSRVAITLFFQALLVLTSSCAEGTRHDMEKRSTVQRLPGDTRLPSKGPRRLADIRLSPDLRKDEVLHIWGPPDAHRGSGVDYLEYALDDGRKLWLNFSPVLPYDLKGAIVSTTNGPFQTLFP